MELLEKRLDEIEPYALNPRKNDAAVDYVANSIKEFGFKVPIVIDADGVIIAGHTRYKAAGRLGLETVPCLLADDLTPDQVKAFRLADNKVSEKAEWDFDLLAEELAGLEDFNMDSFGFEIKEENEKNGEGNFGENGFNYENQYAVTVMCSDEAEQERVYNELTGAGYECKVVTV